MSSRLSTLAIVATGFAAVAVQYAIFDGFFPNATGGVGNDYAYFLPQLLNGAYWFQVNGPFEVPWFTPALGGGIPFYANPQSSYYSLPQWLAFFVDPLAAVRLTSVIFAAAGYAGTYLLLRRRFATGLAAALLGAVVFTLNGFFAARMLVGQLGYHSFMLCPLAAYFLLGGHRGAGVLRNVLGRDTLLAGLVFAYMFQSANVYGIPTVAIFALAIAALARPFGGDGFAVLSRLGVAGLVAGALCAGKLVAAVAFLDNFPRDSYPVPGAESLPGAAELLARVLFASHSDDRIRELLIQDAWGLQEHEFGFGITPVPAFLLLIAAGFCLAQRDARARIARKLRGHSTSFAVFAVLACLPLLINVATPGSSSFVKYIPVLKSSSNLLRHLAFYVPLVIVLSSIALDRAPLPRGGRATLAGLGALGAIALQASADRSHYEEQVYSPNAVVDAWHRARELGSPPPIDRIELVSLADGWPRDRNDPLVRGASAYLLYEPIFGYDLETFPFGPLVSGEALLVQNGRLNLKRPACFLYPGVNGCAPGDHFRAEDLLIARAFSEYRPIPFAVPLLQVVANTLNLLALIAVATVLVASAALRVGRNK